MITFILENQFGFMLEKSTMETIYLFTCLIEKCKERNRDQHMVFIDFEKTYDIVYLEAFWSTL